MKREKTSQPARADITSEQLMLSPEKDGISGVPAISHGFYTTNWHALPPHTHEGCIELCFCSRGSLVFECEGKTYTLMPRLFRGLSPPGFVDLARVKAALRRNRRGGGSWSRTRGR